MNIQKSLPQPLYLFLPQQGWMLASEHITVPYIQWGKKNIWSPADLYVCPLTKKLSIYNLNGRFILTARDRITTKNPEKRISKSYKLICILMSEISIWPLCKTWLSTWWQNPCWQSQRSDVSCSWPTGLHTSQEGFCLGMQQYHFFRSDPIQKILSIGQFRSDPIPAQFFFFFINVEFLLGVTPNSRRFDASIGGAWFDSQSHSRIFAGCYDHAILAIWRCSNLWFHIKLQFSPNKLIYILLK